MFCIEQGAIMHYNTFRPEHFCGSKLFNRCVTNSACVGTSTQPVVLSLFMWQCRRKVKCLFQTQYLLWSVVFMYVHTLPNHKGFHPVVIEATRAASKPSSAKQIQSGLHVLDSVACGSDSAQSWARCEPVSHCWARV